MEYGLGRRNEIILTKEPIGVLILVVMEYGLGHHCYFENEGHISVLILVVMEDGLGQQQSLPNEGW